MKDKRIGLIGLGFMGGAVGRRLLQQGFSLTVYDQDPGAIGRMVDKGATAAGSARGVAQAAEIVLTILPDGPQVEEVVLGANGVLEGMHDGSILVECSTIDPAVTAKVGAIVRGRGWRMLDSAIGRLPKHAEQGKLALMVGALPEDLASVRHVLEAMGNDIFHCGGPTTGITMKLINNMLAQTIMTADSEAMVLGVKAGLTPEIMLKVLTATLADNAALRTSVPDSVLAGDFRPGFKVALAHKDAGLAHNLAARLGVPLFSLAPARQVSSLALAQGKGDLSSTVVGEVLAGLAGVKLTPDKA